MEPSHDACQGDAARGIGDEQVLRLERVLATIEGRELLTVGGAADHHFCNTGRIGLNASKIKGVQRLPRLQHHVVRHIHHVVDAAQTHLLEGRTQPRRARSDL